MLIHLGQNEFVSIKNAEMILNLQTIDDELKKRIIEVLPKLEGEAEYRAAVLTSDGKWHGSTLSPDALAQRGICHPFAQADYLNEDAMKRSYRCIHYKELRND